jgi:hypothetical protein
MSVIMMLTWEEDTINGPSILDGTTITAATFSFGTTEGANLITGVAVPEPNSLVASAIGTGFVGLIVVRGSQRRLLRRSKGA